MDPEKLIEAVRKREVLYVTTSKSYKNVNLKQRAWKEVAEELGMSDENGADACRKRWKTLRDQLSRTMKLEKERKKSGSAGTTVARSHFMELMSFLEPYVAYRETTTNLTADDFEGSQPSQESDREDAGSVHSAADDSTSATRSSPAPVAEAGGQTQKSSAVGLRKKRGPSAEGSKEGASDRVGQEIVKYFKSRQEKNEDVLFLDSLKPMMERVPAHRKFECKMALMNMLHSFEAASHTVPGSQATTYCWSPATPSMGYASASFVAPSQRGAEWFQGGSSWMPTWTSPQAAQGSLPTALGDASHVLLSSTDESTIL